MSEHRDVVVEWAEVSAEAGGPGYRPPQRRASRSFAGVGIATGVIALAAVILGLAVRPSGVGPATSVAASSSAAAVASAASGSPAAPTPSTPIGPVSDQTDDGTLRLSLKIPSNAFETGQPIEPVAILEYLGPDPAITIYHAASPIVFQIREVGGARTMDGGTDTPCLS